MLPLTRARLLTLLILASVTALSACSGGSKDSDGTGGDDGGGSGTTSTAASAPQVSLEKVADGFNRPVYVTAAPGDNSRLFVVEKGGLIRIVKDGQVLPTPFLDVSGLIITQGNEQGLLGLAFHPKYAENGRFFIMYTAKSAGAGDNTVAEYKVSASNPDVADASGAKTLLAIPDKAQNHNGGMVAFGPDGYLYVGTGDGGGAGDTPKNAQNKGVLLGKMLRLDVDNVPAGKTYGIPPTNPFVNEQGTMPEIWAYGLRNPWRFSFDRKTGDLYIGDVGQDKWEEVDFQPASSKGGENYGWNVVEARDCYPESTTTCSHDGFVDPVGAYTHNLGCSITGGYVYRGSKQAALAGWYLFTDYCSGTLWVRKAGDTGNLNSTSAGKTEGSISSFGEDASGELYAVDDDGGRLYRVVASAPTASKPSGAAPKDAVKLVVESPDFVGADAYPAKYTCDGEDTSPAISWNTTPARTRSFAVIVDDEDASNFAHWVLFNIPPVTTFLGANTPEGEQLGAGPIQQGKNGFGKVSYGGPCPPNGKEHRYHITVYALDITLPLVGGATREDVLKALDGHILGKGELVAKYKR